MGVPNCIYIKKMKTYIKFCEKCGEPFTAHRSDKIYCSDKCRIIHYNIIKRLKKRLEKQIMTYQN